MEFISSLSDLLDHVMNIINSLSEALDRITGIESTIVYILISLACIICHSLYNAHMDRKALGDVEDDEPPKPPRNFTLAQLHKFDGTKDEKTDADKPLYLSLDGTVFDVSKGRHFYGPDGPYSTFAGRECGVCMARMSFDDKELDDVEGCRTKLSAAEKGELEGWIEKFTYWRPYAVVGRLVPPSRLPSKDRAVSVDELRRNDGTGPIPEGYAAAPIYLACKGKVYDMSFGGVEFYGEGCAYNKFAGRDASRALAKMSFDPEDIERGGDVADLEEKQLKVLDDWVKTFEEKKQYPCVGILQK